MPRQLHSGATPPEVPLRDAGKQPRDNGSDAPAECLADDVAAPHRHARHPARQLEGLLQVPAAPASRRRQPRTVWTDARDVLGMLPFAAGKLCAERDPNGDVQTSPWAELTVFACRWTCLRDVASCRFGSRGPCELETMGSKFRQERWSSMLVCMLKMITLWLAITSF